MDYSSEEESDISESEIKEYSEKPYKLLKDGNYKVKNFNGTLRCPYCAGKKKQEFKYKDLLQHASGVGKGSATRSAKQKANHLALAKYLETDLINEADQIPQPALIQPVNQPAQPVENYVWPWTGIIVNIKSNLQDSAYWLKEFSKYKPLNFHIFLVDGEAQAVIDFNNDWNGFMNASEFEKSFETKHHGKKDWNSMHFQASSEIYGWVAREDDYNCGGPIGEYLRNKGRLRTISDIVQEASESRNSIVENLANEIDITNENLNKMQYTYNEKTMSLSRMLEEKDKLHNAFVEESRSMQRKAREELHRIFEEQEKMSNELDEKMRKLDSWSRDLNKREVLTDQERQKLDEDKKKKDLRNETLLLASKEQKIADANFLKLVEEQKREKEEYLNKNLQLEKQLDAKQKLEMEREELRGKLQVMKHLGDQDDAAIKKKMEEMNDELNDKIESLEDMESMNQTLIVKERQSNDELQEARKELIEGLNALMPRPKGPKPPKPANIGTKRMGELDQQVFVDACEKRYFEEDGTKAMELCSFWQENVKDPAWRPFKMIKVNDTHESVIDEEDEKLKKLKQEWGDEVYSAVVTAVKEVNEYNPSGGYSVWELWNFKEKRKATLKEVITYIVEQMKQKRKRG
ncbi:protein INVOLVED IN DE NOVO [Trifolium repens]|nr:protein INVOLVED IN DE NOVO [Trifolium repens]